MNNAQLQKPTQDHTNNLPNLQYNKEEALSYNNSQSYSGAEWQKMQHILNETVDSSLEVTGSPNESTADAVYTFQLNNRMSLKDGKLGPKTKEAINARRNVQQSSSNTSIPRNVTIPSGSTIMSKSYTPNLDLLLRHANSESLDVKDVGTSANYVARYCTGGSSQHQCTRGTALFLQLSSYARGEADSRYKSSCAAHLFGSANALTNYNISSSVAGEYSIKTGENKTGKSNMNTYITDNLKKDGEFVTFKYSSSQHIVFYSCGKWYSDFKQGTPAGCGGSSTLYSNIHFFNK